jgi:hypothetical protein
MERSDLFTPAGTRRERFAPGSPLVYFEGRRGTRSPPACRRRDRQFVGALRIARIDFVGEGTAECLVRAYTDRFRELLGSSRRIFERVSRFRPGLPNHPNIHAQMGRGYQRSHGGRCGGKLGRHRRWRLLRRSGRGRGQGEGGSCPRTLGSGDKGSLVHVAA